MLWIYIILIILMICILILVTPISLIIKYENQLEIHLKIWGISFKLPFSRTNKKSKAKNKKKHTPSPKNNILSSFKLIIKVIKASLKSLKKISHKININNLKIILDVGSPDSATTAIRYGQASAVVYSLASLISSVSPPKKYEVTVRPDFLKEKIYTDAEISISSRVFNILSMFVIFAKHYRELT